MFVCLCVRVRSHASQGTVCLLEYSQFSECRRCLRWQCWCFVWNVLYITSSYQKCSITKRNFAKFTGKHLCQSLFFNKVANLRTYEISKNTLYRSPLDDCFCCIHITVVLLVHRFIPLMITLFCAWADADELSDIEQEKKEAGKEKIKRKNNKEREK